MGLLERVIRYNVKYLGGHPSIDKPCGGTLYVHKDNISFKATSRGEFTLQYNEITGVFVETEKTLSALKTAAKWMVSPAWGLISGLKGEKQYFLRVEYKDKTGFESDILFQFKGKKAHEAKARIISFKHKALSS